MRKREIPFRNFKNMLVNGRSAELSTLTPEKLRQWRERLKAEGIHGNNS